MDWGAGDLGSNVHGGGIQVCEVPSEGLRSQAGSLCHWPVQGPKWRPFDCRLSSLGNAILTISAWLHLLGGQFRPSFLPTLINSPANFKTQKYYWHRKFRCNDGLRWIGSMVVSEVEYFGHAKTFSHPANIIVVDLKVYNFNDLLGRLVSWFILSSFTSRSDLWVVTFVPYVFIDLVFYCTTSLW